MKKNSPAATLPNIENLIVTLRDQKVILDADLARIYGVPTRALNQAIKRNLQRFPQDFAFQFTGQGWEALRSQIVTLKKGGGTHRTLLTASSVKRLK